MVVAYHSGLGCTFIVYIGTSPCRLLVYSGLELDLINLAIWVCSRLEEWISKAWQFGSSGTLIKLAYVLHVHVPCTQHQYNAFNWDWFSNAWLVIVSPEEHDDIPPFSTFWGMLHWLESWTLICPSISSWTHPWASNDSLLTWTAYEILRLICCQVCQGYTVIGEIILIYFGFVRVGRQVVNIPSFMVRVDSQKHIDFSLTSPFGGGRPGRVKRRNQKAATKKASGGDGDEEDEE